MSKLTISELLDEEFYADEDGNCEYFIKGSINSKIRVSLETDIPILTILGEYRAMSFPVETIEDVRKIMGDLGLNSQKSDI